ncbi:hypothetical protein ENSA5_70150 [Enhygromyxa salina]|uniref:Uncharacterized protein n=1 Tax=Enhygromyxa salina TaxID=215803 RepID=A0A2S9XAN0_9BACT|nr:hypothetical protein [Enhygromyxa salina]PRP89908.1 hypothetical protein ENSA5_70150 [Enhygromyxa salina]
MFGPGLGVSVVIFACTSHALGDARSDDAWPLGGPDGEPAPSLELLFVAVGR